MHKNNAMTNVFCGPVSHTIKFFNIWPLYDFAFIVSKTIYPYYKLYLLSSDYLAEYPPSTVTIEPITHVDSSDASQTAAQAMSSG